jgi:DNA invertase Pin-like site-specific DNA recombinase
MFPRLLRAWVRRAQRDGDLDAFAALARHREDVDAHLADMATVLRAEPWCYSWQEIADALGIRKQAAHRRWRKAGGARRPGAQPGNLR